MCCLRPVVEGWLIPFICTVWITGSAAGRPYGALPAPMTEGEPTMFQWTNLSPSHLIAGQRLPEALATEDCGFGRPSALGGCLTYSLSSGQRSPIRSVTSCGGAPGSDAASD